MNASTFDHFGCTSCGHTIQVTSPDSVYTEAYRKFRYNITNWLDILDNITMNVRCPKCDGNNKIYWYKSYRYGY